MRTKAVGTNNKGDFLFFNSKSLNFSEVKTQLSTQENTLSLSPLPSKLVSEHGQICRQKVRMRYQMSVIYGHPVIAATRALRFADHVTKRNGDAGDENVDGCNRRTFSIFQFAIMHYVCPPNFA